MAAPVGPCQVSFVAPEADAWIGAAWAQGSEEWPTQHWLVAGTRPGCAYPPALCSAGKRPPAIRAALLPAAYAPVCSQAKPLVAVLAGVHVCTAKEAEDGPSEDGPQAST